VKTLQEHKRYIWNQIKSGKWSLAHVLKLEGDLTNPEWNHAIADAKQWVRLEIIKKQAKKPLKAGRLNTIKRSTKVSKMKQKNAPKRDSKPKDLDWDDKNKRYRHKERADYRPGGKEVCYICDGKGGGNGRKCSKCRGTGYL